MIIALDITLLAIEYAGYYDIQTTYKAAVYSVKLKMEFSILNKLLDLFQGRIHDSSTDPNSRSHRNTTFMGSKKNGSKSNPTVSGTVLSVNGASSKLGNSAYARMDDAGPAISLKDMTVMKTTDIRVERSERDINDADIDSLSLGGVSVKDGVGITLERDSKSSSEIQMVRSGY